MTREFPFGLRAGMDLSEFSPRPDEAAPGIYRLNVPKPHPEFVTYLGLISPRVGLQWMKAIGKETKTNTYGTAIRSKFDEFCDRLSRVYGNGRKQEIILPEAMYNQPEDFMRAIECGERAILMTWDRTTGASIEPPLSSVSLSILAIDDGTGFLTLEYTLNLHDEARQDIANQQDSVL